MGNPHRHLDKHHIDRRSFMVTPSEEPQVEAPVAAPEPQTEVEGEGFQPEINPLIAEVDKLNSVPDVDISEPVTETTTEEPVAAEAPEAPPETPTESAPQPTPEQPTQPQLNPEQLQQLQRQAAEYEQVRQRAAVQRQQQEVQKQYEAQGASPEDAYKQAQQYVQSQTAQQDLVRQADNYGKLITAKQQVAEQLATKYELQITDLNVLKQAESPEIMESLAGEIQQRRKMEAELQELRKKQVPAQQYDNSQGAPEVASNDGNWLDRYNAGDRSANATAAARRAMGME